MIATHPGIAFRPHRVQLQNPGEPIPDGDGGYTQTWTDCDPPAVWAEIKAATQADLERQTAGTTITVATHVLTAPWHPGVTIASRCLYGAREFQVASVQNVEERGHTMILFCVEVKPE